MVGMMTTKASLSLPNVTFLLSPFWPVPTNTKHCQQQRLSHGHHYPLHINSMARQEHGYLHTDQSFWRSLFSSTCFKKPTTGLYESSPHPHSISLRYILMLSLSSDLKLGLPSGSLPFRFYNMLYTLFPL
jgi:hypothetical protein